MPDPAGGQKSRLTLTRYRVNADGTVTIDASVATTVMINPAEVRHTHSISYDHTQTLGQVAADPKFAAVGPEKLSFSLVFDGTGAVPLPPGETAKDVKTRLQELRQVVYAYVGTQHEPGHVRLLWGSLIFFGRLESMTTAFTLFKPGGDPLRAKIELAFVGAMSKQAAALVSNRSSPDLSHQVLVREGDTLPLLCWRIYGDAAYYPEVARFNRLADFRRLAPGLRLQFPPLQAAGGRRR